MTTDHVILARLKLILEERYWGILAAFLSLREGESVNVDGKYLTYNPNDDLTIDAFNLQVKSSIESYIINGRGTTHYEEFMKIVQNAEKCKNIK